MSATSQARNLALSLFSVAALLAGGTAVVRGQSALDGFDPNANGSMNVVVAQPDGKIIIGGSFTSVAPNGGAAFTRNHIARFNPDGTLDLAFNPNANGEVFSIVPLGDGKVLVGGLFTSIGGQPRNRIARLEAVTGAADAFDPNANDYVNAIGVQADGKVVAGGQFTSMGGQTRNRIARLEAGTGAVDGGVRPEREQCCLVHRGAGGRQGSGGRLFHHHRRADAQPNRAARGGDRRS